MLAMDLAQTEYLKSSVWMVWNFISMLSLYARDKSPEEQRTRGWLRFVPV